MALFKQLDDQVEQLLSLFKKDDNWLIVINADPDALGSALALRRIMARRVNDSAIAQINEIKRPDNLAMIRYLRIPTQKLIPNLAAQYDKFALVDSQPHHNPEFKQFDFSVVIDHHPVSQDTEVKADFVDIRPKYGAVCTMMTEYLYNMKIRPAKLLATALMYGIRCDTRTFEREFIDPDMAAFKYLSKFADSKLMNRISRSEFHLDWMRYFSRAFYNLRRIGQGLYAHAGNVENPDILVIVADFFTRVHNVPWVCVSGVADDKLVCIFRGDGQRRIMGTMAQKLMNGLGSAGGHAMAARAEVEIADLDGEDPEIFMLKRFGKGKKKNIRRI
ncbi:MAG: DHH family phosphoesterase [Pseudodesulfovibrio sp.]